MNLTTQSPTSQAAAVPKQPILCEAIRSDSASGQHASNNWMGGDLFGVMALKGLVLCEMLNHVEAVEALVHWHLHVGSQVGQRTGLPYSSFRNTWAP